MFEEVEGIMHWKPANFQSNLNEGSQANDCNWEWADFSEVAEYLVRSEVHHPNAFDDSHFTNIDGPLPDVAAEIELFINDRAFGMWGAASPESLFVRTSAYSRPFMILARALTPLALRCARTGEDPELRTFFGVGEFLYPRVLGAVEERLADESHPRP